MGAKEKGQRTTRPLRGGAAGAAGDADDAAPNGKQGPPADAEPSVRSMLDPVSQPQSARLRRQRAIAEGGMGYIEEVLDDGMKRRLAKKIIHDRLQGDSRTVAMFIREAQITGQLDHPNIVPVHELGLDATGRLFFSMKLVKGRTLTELIAQLPPGPIEHGTLLNLLDVLVKVCDALALAHDRGVIHCDIKPENVMVGDFGEVYLMDWGLARIVDGATAETTIFSQEGTGSFLGTPAYMSPEQAQGRNNEMDERTDVFGVGTILYEIITRAPPFRGNGPWQAIAAAQECKHPPLSEPGVPPPVPMGLIHIAERAMAKSPDRRHPSANALKQALVGFIRGGGQFPVVNISAGVHAVREGDPGESAYIMVSGRCEVYKTIDGERVTLRTLGPGDVFGETAILSPGPRTASVVALEPTSLRVVTREVLEAELSSMKPWMGAFIRALAERFRESEQRRARDPDESGDQ